MDISIKYPYERTGNYPLAGAGNLNAGLARHHILSFPFMLSFAVVTFWYIATHQNDAASYAEAMLDNFFRDDKRNQNGWLTLCGCFNKKDTQLYFGQEIQDAKSALNWICWAESNLFIGPAGKHRIDDPSQKMDHIPLSMGATKKGKKVMDKAAEVKSVWATVCHSGNSGEDGQPITLSINDQAVPNFVKVFAEYICLSEADVIYRSKYSDWAAYLATDTSGKTPHQFWINTSRSCDDNQKACYQFALRDKAAVPKENWVCITNFDDKKVMGIEAGKPGSDCIDKTF